MLAANITHCGQLAEAVLEEQHGDIYAVFNSTIYMQANQALCCLGTDNLPTGPLNIQTTLQSINGLIAGDHWHFTSHQLILADRYLLSTITTRYLIPPQQYSQIIDSTVSRPMLDRIISAINCANNKPQIAKLHSGAIPASTVIIEDRLQDYCSLLTRWLEEQFFNPKTKVPDELCGIIGCGDGLTPAGDDILVGVLVAMRVLGFESGFAELRQWVADTSPGRTNRISQSHLSAACEGQAVSHVHDLLEAIKDSVDAAKKSMDSRATTYENALTNAATALAQYGHSSGYHTLSGVILVLKSLSKSKAMQL